MDPDRPARWRRLTIGREVKTNATHLDMFGLDIALRVMHYLEMVDVPASTNPMKNESVQIKNSHARWALPVVKLVAREHETCKRI